MFNQRLSTILDREGERHVKYHWEMKYMYICSTNSIPRTTWRKLRKPEREGIEPENLYQKLITKISSIKAILEIAI
jgi:hypothetical protein